MFNIRAAANTRAALRYTPKSVHSLTTRSRAISIAETSARETSLDRGSYFAMHRERCVHAAAHAHAGAGTESAFVIRDS